MNPAAIYLGLLVYGAGALVLSLLGAFGHDHGHDGAHDNDGAQGQGHGAQGHDSQGHDSQGHDAHGHGHDAAQRPDGSVAVLERPRGGEAGTGAVSRIASILRSSVYLSLGAGATGLFAASRGLGPLEAAAWAAGAGVLVLAIARLVRRLVRRDLDSSFRSEEFLMEECVVVVGAAPGEMGKAELRKYGASVELYIKSADASLALAKGSRARIVDCGEECYLVEPVPSGGQEA
jgi:hypothetical protein